MRIGWKGNDKVKVNECYRASHYLQLALLLLLCLVVAVAMVMAGNDFFWEGCVKNMTLTSTRLVVALPRFLAVSNTNKSIESWRRIVTTASVDLSPPATSHWASTPGTPIWPISVDYKINKNDFLGKSTAPICILQFSIFSRSVYSEDEMLTVIS